MLLVSGVYLLISFAFLYGLPLEEIVANTAFGCFVIGLLILINDPLPALLGVAVVLEPCR